MGVRKTNRFIQNKNSNQDKTNREGPQSVLYKIVWKYDINDSPKNKIECQEVGDVEWVTGK